MFPTKSFKSRKRLKITQDVVIKGFFINCWKTIHSNSRESPLSISSKKLWVYSFFIYLIVFTHSLLSPSITSHFDLEKIKINSDNFISKENLPNKASIGTSPPWILVRSSPYKNSFSFNDILQSYLISSNWLFNKIFKMLRKVYPWLTRKVFTTIKNFDCLF